MSERKHDVNDKRELVQFRLDSSLFEHVSHIANRLDIPVGTLARLWVTERLQKELSSDLQAIGAWLNERYSLFVPRLDEKFPAGPIQILHMVPVQQNEIDPESVRAYQTMLPPMENVRQFMGRINLDGYATFIGSSNPDKLSGIVQIFRNGALESIRIVAQDQENMVTAERLDAEIIKSVWSYSCALEALGVKTPVIVRIGFHRMFGCVVQSRRLGAEVSAFDQKSFVLTDLVINDWAEVNALDKAAQTLKKTLDQLANGAGMSRSLSYLTDGEWIGVSQAQRKAAPHARARLQPKTELITLSGLDRSPNRVELYMHEGGARLTLGKVRPPYLQPSAKTRFKCHLLLDEVEPDAKFLLEGKAVLGEMAQFSLGQMKFAGRITRILEGYGSFIDGVSIRQEPTLLFEVEPQAVTR